MEQRPSAGRSRLEARRKHGRIGSAPLYTSSDEGESQESNCAHKKPHDIEFPPELRNHYYVRDPTCTEAFELYLPITDREAVPIAVLPSPSASSRVGSVASSTPRDLDAELAAMTPVTGVPSAMVGDRRRRTLSPPSYPTTSGRAQLAPQQPFAYGTPGQLPHPHALPRRQPHAPADRAYATDLPPHRRRTTSPQPLATCTTPGAASPDLGPGALPRSSRSRIPAGGPHGHAVAQLRSARPGTDPRLVQSVDGIPLPRANRILGPRHPCMSVAGARDRPSALSPALRPPLAAHSDHRSGHGREHGNDRHEERHHRRPNYQRLDPSPGVEGTSPNLHRPHRSSQQSAGTRSGGRIPGPPGELGYEPTSPLRPQKLPLPSPSPSCHAAQSPAETPASSSLALQLPASPSSRLVEFQGSELGYVSVGIQVPENLGKAPSGSAEARSSDCGGSGSWRPLAVQVHVEAEATDSWVNPGSCLGEAEGKAPEAAAGHGSAAPDSMRTRPRNDALAAASASSLVPQMRSVSNSKEQLLARLPAAAEAVDVAQATIEPASREAQSAPATESAGAAPISPADRPLGSEGPQHQAAAKAPVTLGIGVLTPVHSEERPEVDATATTDAAGPSFPLFAAVDPATTDGAPAPLALSPTDTTGPSPFRLDRTCGLPSSPGRTPASRKTGWSADEAADGAETDSSPLRTTAGPRRQDADPATDPTAEAETPASPAADSRSHSYNPDDWEPGSSDAEAAAAAVLLSLGAPSNATLALASVCALLEQPDGNGDLLLSDGDAAVLFSPEEDAAAPWPSPRPLPGQRRAVDFVMELTPFPSGNPDPCQFHSLPTGQELASPDFRLTPDLGLSPDFNLLYSPSSYGPCSRQPSPLSPMSRRRRSPLPRPEQDPIRYRHSDGGPAPQAASPTSGEGPLGVASDHLSPPATGEVHHLRVTSCVGLVHDTVIAHGPRPGTASVLVAQVDSMVRTPASPAPVLSHGSAVHSPAGPGARSPCGELRSPMTPSSPILNGHTPMSATPSSLASGASSSGSGGGGSSYRASTGGTAGRIGICSCVVKEATVADGHKSSAAHLLVSSSTDVLLGDAPAASAAPSGSPLEASSEPGQRTGVAAAGAEAERSTAWAQYGSPDPGLMGLTPRRDDLLPLDDATFASPPSRPVLVDESRPGAVSVNCLFSPMASPMPFETCTDASGMDMPALLAANGAEQQGSGLTPTGSRSPGTRACGGEGQPDCGEGPRGLAMLLGPGDSAGLERPEEGRHQQAAEGPCSDEEALLHDSVAAVMLNPLFSSTSDYEASSSASDSRPGSPEKTSSDCCGQLPVGLEEDVRQPAASPSAPAQEFPKPCIVVNAADSPGTSITANGLQAMQTGASDGCSHAFNTSHVHGRDCTSVDRPRLEAPVEPPAATLAGEAGPGLQPGPDSGSTSSADWAGALDPFQLPVPSTESLLSMDSPGRASSSSLGASRLTSPRHAASSPRHAATGQGSSVPSSSGGASSRGHADAEAWAGGNVQVLDLTKLRQAFKKGGNRQASPMAAGSPDRAFAAADVIPKAIEEAVPASDETGLTSVPDVAASGTPVTAAAALAVGEVGAARGEAETAPTAVAYLAFMPAMPADSDATAAAAVGADADESCEHHSAKLLPPVDVNDCPGSAGLDSSPLERGYLDSMKRGAESLAQPPNEMETGLGTTGCTDGLSQALRVADDAVAGTIPASGSLDSGSACPAPGAPVAADALCTVATVWLPPPPSPSSTSQVESSPDKDHRSPSGVGVDGSPAEAPEMIEVDRSTSCGVLAPCPSFAATPALVSAAVWPAYEPAPSLSDGGGSLLRPLHNAGRADQPRDIGCVPAQPTAEGVKTAMTLVATETDAAGAALWEDAPSPPPRTDELSATIGGELEEAGPCVAGPQQVAVATGPEDAVPGAAPSEQVGSAGDTGLTAADQAVENENAESAGRVAPLAATADRAAEAEPLASAEATFSHVPIAAPGTLPLQRRLFSQVVSGTVCIAATSCPLSGPAAAAGVDSTDGKSFGVLPSMDAGLLLDAETHPDPPAAASSGAPFGFHAAGSESPVSDAECASSDAPAVRAALSPLDGCLPSLSDGVSDLRLTGRASSRLPSPAVPLPAGQPTGLSRSASSGGSRLPSFKPADPPLAAAPTAAAVTPEAPKPLPTQGAPGKPRSRLPSPPSAVVAAAAAASGGNPGSDVGTPPGAGLAASRLPSPSLVAAAGPTPQDAVDAAPVLPRASKLPSPFMVVAGASPQDAVGAAPAPSRASRLPSPSAAAQSDAPSAAATESWRQDRNGQIESTAMPAQRPAASRGSKLPSPASAGPPLAPADAHSSGPAAVADDCRVGDEALPGRRPGRFGIQLPTPPVNQVLDMGFDRPAAAVVDQPSEPSSDSEPLAVDSPSKAEGLTAPIPGDVPPTLLGQHEEQGDLPEAPEANGRVSMPEATEANGQASAPEATEATNGQVRLPEAPDANNGQVSPSEVPAVDGELSPFEATEANGQTSTPVHIGTLGQVSASNSSMKTEAASLVLDAAEPGLPSSLPAEVTIEAAPASDSAPEEALPSVPSSSVVLHQDVTSAPPAAAEARLDRDGTSLAPVPQSTGPDLPLADEAGAALQVTHALASHQSQDAEHEGDKMVGEAVGQGHSSCRAQLASELRREETPGSPRMASGTPDAHAGVSDGASTDPIGAIAAEEQERRGDPDQEQRLDVQPESPPALHQPESPPALHARHQPQSEPRPEPFQSSEQVDDARLADTREQLPVIGAGVAPPAAQSAGPRRATSWLRSLLQPLLILVLTGAALLLLRTGLSGAGSRGPGQRAGGPWPPALRTSAPLRQHAAWAGALHPSLHPNASCVAPWVWDIRSGARDSDYYAELLRDMWDRGFDIDAALQEPGLDAELVRNRDPAEGGALGQPQQVDWPQEQPQNARAGTGAEEVPAEGPGDAQLHDTEVMLGSAVANAGDSAGSMPAMPIQSSSSEEPESQAEHQGESVRLQPEASYTVPTVPTAEGTAGTWEAAVAEAQPGQDDPAAPVDVLTEAPDSTAGARPDSEVAWPVGTELVRSEGAGMDPELEGDMRYAGTQAGDRGQSVSRQDVPIMHDPFLAGNLPDVVPGAEMDVAARVAVPASSASLAAAASHAPEEVLPEHDAPAVATASTADQVPTVAATAASEPARTQHARTDTVPMPAIGNAVGVARSFAASFCAAGMSGLLRWSGLCVAASVVALVGVLLRARLRRTPRDVASVPSVWDVDPLSPGKVTPGSFRQTRRPGGGSSAGRAALPYTAAANGFSQGLRSIGRASDGLGAAAYGSSYPYNVYEAYEPVDERPAVLTASYWMPQGSRGGSTEAAAATGLRSPPRTRQRGRSSSGGDGSPGTPSRGSPRCSQESGGGVSYHFLRNRMVWVYNEAEMSPEARRLVADQRHY